MRETTAASSSQTTVRPPRAGGPKRTSGRTPAARGTPDQSSCHRAHQRQCPRAKVSPAAPAPPARPPHHHRARPTAEGTHHTPCPSPQPRRLPAPGAPSSTGGRQRQGRLRRRCAGAARPLTQPPARRTPGTHQEQGAHWRTPQTPPNSTQTPSCSTAPAQVSGTSALLLTPQRAGRCRQGLRKGRVRGSSGRLSPAAGGAYRRDSAQWYVPRTDPLPGVLHSGDRGGHRGCLSQATGAGGYRLVG